MEEKYVNIDFAVSLFRCTLCGMSEDKIEYWTNYFRQLLEKNSIEINNKGDTIMGCIKKK